MKTDTMCRRHFGNVIDKGHNAWSSLIISNMKQGKPQLGLLSYDKMRVSSSLYPNAFAFVALLKACGELKDLGKAQVLHLDICKIGLLEGDQFVANSVVDVYAKCNSLSQAQAVFDMLPTRDRVSWNVLIAGYAKHEHGKAALYCFNQMQDDGYIPNAITYATCLKACGSIGDINQGIVIHSEIKHKGLVEKNLVVGNSLIDMYAKCGELEKAIEVFNSIPRRDVFSWNALISGFVKFNQFDQALNCFKQMQVNEISPNTAIFISILKACGSIPSVYEGANIHAEILRTGVWERDCNVGNALVDMYVKCGFLVKAQEVFDKLIHKNVVSWTALIAGYAKYECPEKALNCYMEMQLEGVSPNSVTLVCCLKACTSIGAICEGIEIHVEAARKSFLEREILVSNALIDLYGKYGYLSRAQDVFDKLPAGDVVSWTTLIAGYTTFQYCKKALMYFEKMKLEGISPNTATYVCALKACGSLGAVDKGTEIYEEISRKGFLEKDIIIGNALIDMYSKCGHIAKAQEVFDKLSVRDVVSWTSLMAGYATHESGDYNLNCLELMELDKVSPNVVTIICSLKACYHVGAIDKGKEIHAEAVRKGLLEKEIIVGNALVDMYAKCGSITKAQETFNKLPIRDVITWNILISGYAQVGKLEDVFFTFEKMRGELDKPDYVTYLNLLSACNRAGLVDKGQLYYESMRKDFGIVPKLEHETCMVNLFCRTGQIDYIKNNMPLHPDSVVWQTILDASQQWGNFELGKEAYDCMLQLDENDASAYVSMCNIFTDSMLNVRV